ncbi:hypothetical protein EON65_03585 [archaeon]|nr:MAG: hypothetical protein EON65_03585 [archaeon]
MMAKNERVDITKGSILSREDTEMDRSAKMQDQIDKLDARVAILETYLFGLQTSTSFPDLSSPNDPSLSLFNTVSMSPSIAEKNWLGIKTEPLEELPIKDSWLDQLVATPPSTPPVYNKKKISYSKEDMVAIFQEMKREEREIPTLPLLGDVTVIPETTTTTSTSPQPEELQRSLSGPASLFIKSYSEATVADMRDTKTGGVWEKVESRGRAKSMGDCKRPQARTVEKVTASSAMITIANIEKSLPPKASHKSKEGTGGSSRSTSKVTPEPSPKSEVKFGLLVQYPDH